VATGCNALVDLSVAEMESSENPKTKSCIQRIKFIKNQDFFLKDKIVSDVQNNCGIWHAIIYAIL